MSALDGLEVFVLTVERGSFAAAARKLGVTASAVSRRIARLEDELGAHLIARTTRRLQLTTCGRAFHERSLRILGELEEARRAVSQARARPSGLLRVEAAVALTRAVLGPRLPEFLARYPEVRVELAARDAVIDPVAEGLDVVIRVGALADSELIARRLGAATLVYCAAPAYLRRRGTPRAPADLARHDVLGYLRDGRTDPWRFPGAGGAPPVQVVPRGPLASNDIDALRAAALAGRGIVAALDFLVEEALRDGRLVRVLADSPSEAWPIHALYPRSRHLLPKLAVFLDFAAECFGGSAAAAGRRRGQRAAGAAVPAAARTKAITARTARERARARG